MYGQFSDLATLNQQIHGVINVEAPNNRIYNFDGSYDMSSDFNNPNLVPLSIENVALRGMSLRNTENVTGFVVYSGHDTKIQMNSSKSVYKTSNISRRTNNLIFQVFMI